MLKYRADGVSTSPNVGRAVPTLSGIIVQAKELQLLINIATTHPLYTFPPTIIH